jgi:hypothetical protein
VVTDPPIRHLPVRDSRLADPPIRVPRIPRSAQRRRRCAANLAGLVTLSRMADAAHPSLSETSSFSSAGDYAGLVSGIKSFATHHGGATAAIEYHGRRGARIVLSGQDGALLDHYAENTEQARQVCELAGVALRNEWAAELEEHMRPSRDLWRSMGRRVFSR